ncbi:E4 17 kDa protein [Human mastadenovirus D]|uniref:E4 17 kDa protein n=1 Tax=Human mastadenovirus D TaxID=130310 RepID=T1UGG2_9ADEN|nr:E4 17 kDa protein [Human mastadenovirus D]
MCCWLYPATRVSSPLGYDSDPRGNKNFKKMYVSVPVPCYPGLGESSDGERVRALDPALSLLIPGLLAVPGGRCPAGRVVQESHLRVHVQPALPLVPSDCEQRHAQRDHVYGQCVHEGQAPDILPHLVRWSRGFHHPQHELWLERPELWAAE